MIGRSLLPFGDTFAVLMVVFLVLSLSVGSAVIGPEGSADREPMLVVIGNNDPFRVHADGFLGVSSNATDTLAWQTNRSRPVKIDRLLNFFEDVSEDAQIVAALARERFAEEFNEDLFQSLPDAREYEQSVGALDELRFGSVRTWRIDSSGDGAAHLVIGRDFRIDQQPETPPPDLFELTNACAPYQPVPQSPDALAVADISLTGFGHSSGSGLLSASIEAERSEDIVISGLFEANRTPRPLDEMVQTLSYFQAQCVGYKDHDPEAYDAGRIDGASQCVSFRPWLRLFLPFAVVDVPSPPHLSRVQTRGGPVLVVPRSEADRRTVGELATHMLHPEPVRINIYLANGRTRSFRTPTWWEMFVAPGTLGGVRAYQAGQTTCETLRPAFEDRTDEGVRSARVFEFHLVIRPNGQIDHSDTLIELE